MKINLTITLLLLFAIFSCSGKNDKKVVTFSEDTETLSEEGKISESDDLSEEDSDSYDLSAEDDIADDYDQSSYADAEINDIRLALNEGNLNRVLVLTEDSSNEELRFYRGIAYYRMMLMRERFSDSRRVEYRDNAIELLQKVGYGSRNLNLSARAFLWYSMAIHLNYESLSKKRKALGALYRIQSTDLAETEYYDDSLLFSAQIYKQMGWYVQSRRFYKELQVVDSQDDRVWNPEKKRYLSPAEAGRQGLAEVRKICFPEEGIVDSGRNKKKNR